MCDGAGSHNYRKFLSFAKEELEKRQEPNYISKEWMYGVPNTTFSTQPLDCGINKFFKAKYYKKANAWKNLQKPGMIACRSRCLIWIIESYMEFQ